MQFLGCLDEIVITTMKLVIGYEHQYDDYGIAINQNLDRPISTLNSEQLIKW